MKDSTDELITRLINSHFYSGFKAKIKLTEWSKV